MALIKNDTKLYPKCSDLEAQTKLLDEVLKLLEDICQEVCVDLNCGF